jgi:hypothetical protein
MDRWTRSFPKAILTVTSLVNSALSSVRAAKELAKDSSDTVVKERIAEVFDSFLNIKDRILALDEENRALKEQLAKRAAFKRNSEFGYYFAEGDPDPYCPKCYEGAGKEIHLPKASDRAGGLMRVRRVCQHLFIEGKHQLGSPDTSSRNPWG